MLPRRRCCRTTGWRELKRRTANRSESLDSIYGKDKENKKADMKTDIVIFENGKYNASFIYPVLVDASVSGIRNKLRAALKAKTGVDPGFFGEDKLDVRADTFEVLLGNTNRPESAAPAGVVEDIDTYYTVAVIGNKIVINGSDSYHLGVAVDRFIESYLSGGVTEKLTVPSDLFRQEIFEGYTRAFWGLGGIPAYPIGVNRLVVNAYLCGTKISEVSANRNKSDASLHRIDKTNLTEFESYLAKLESFGFEKEYENLTSENLFLTYRNGERRVHVSFKPRLNEVQVISDPKGLNIEEFGYSYTPVDGKRSEYYLYGIPMCDGRGNNHPNAGTLSVIKCADNSVIVVDGGAYEGDGGTQMYGKEVMDAFDAFLHQITETPDGEKVTISCWYLTHYHADHVRGLLEFLKAYNANYELERIIANIPIQTCGGTENPFSTAMTNWGFKMFDEWSALIKSTYPNCRELKVHAGQKIRIADVTLDVLYTHEDLLTNMGRFGSADSNDTSTVVRVDNGQMSMIIMGDAGQRTESRLRRTYTEATLKSDIVQPAHHLIYDVMTIFKEIQPSFALVTQSVECMQSSSTLPGQGSYKERYDKLMSLVPRDHCYFAGNETVGLAVVNGEIQVIYHVDGVVGRQVGQG